MKKIKVAVIGVGYLGRFHAQKYAGMDDVELVGVVDIDKSHAEDVASECNTTAYSDFREVLELIDAASIVVPTSNHHEVALACLEKRVDILVEKPITTTLAEADELIDRAADNDCILQVGHLERFNPVVMALEPMLTHPLFIEAQRISVFKNRGVDVDVVLDLMIHDIDIILTIVDSPLVTIHTIGTPVVTNSTDIANARLIFENGCTANITVSRISMSNIRRMRVFQPGAYLSVDFSKKEIMTIALKKELTSEGFPQPEVEKNRFVEQDVLELELVDFISNVRHRSRPKVSGHEGRRALDVALQVIEQIQENRKAIQDVLDASSDS